VKLRVLAAGSLLALTALPAYAVVTATWQVETYQQFDAGDATSAFITSLGEVRPGWDTKRTALEGDGVWSALRLADGTVLVGSDDAGAILKVTDGGAKKLGSIDGAIAVVALAQGSSGVYAAAMPGNKVWKLDTATGKSTAVATIKGVETVWSLAVGTDGTVYAGTGPDGKLFSVKGGTVKEIYATEDKRVTAVTVDKDGMVWFGTSERALVFRYDPKASGGNATRAMADFAGNEIGAIAALGGGVVVAANDLAETTGIGAKSAAQVEAAEKPAAPKGQAAKTPDVGTKPGADKDAPAATDTGRKGARKGKGALFRVGSDGRLEQLHALTATYFTSVAVAPDGSIYAGAADKGRVYLVEADDTVATAFDVDERAVSQLFWDKTNLAFTTDDAAALYRATARASQAKYVSDVLDAKAVAKFGRLQWQASGKLKLETRSGNTAKPGTGWSAWSAPQNVGKMGGGADGGKIASPPGRYFQFRVSFDEADAKLRRVSTFYVPQNEATSIEEVTIEPVQKETAPTLKDSAAKPRSPVLRIKWKAENPDTDDTSYKLEARREGEANWRPLATGKAPLTATQWEWNTETFPDGWYRVRATSSDAMANSPDRALTSSKTTPLFAVDNTRPSIDGLSVSYPRATARASDALGVITEMAFSVDDDTWQLGTTADGIYDDLVEDLRIDLPAGLAKGTHTLAVRVADAAGNIGSISVTFVVK
jgi:hypothetical protein